MLGFVLRSLSQPSPLMNAPAPPVGSSNSNLPTPHPQVFDIDETVLSNAAEWMAGGTGELLPTPVTSTKQQLYSFDRPALAAVHELFLFLYHSHYSVRTVPPSLPAGLGARAGCDGGLQQGG